MGREVTAELLFTGRIVDAREALAMRLVSRVVPHDELLPDRARPGDEHRRQSPAGGAGTQAGLRQALDPEWDELGRWVSSTLAELFRTDDHREGVQAFLDKRDAVYTGR